MKPTRIILVLLARTAGDLPVVQSGRKGESRMQLFKSNRFFGVMVKVGLGVIVAIGALQGLFFTVLTVSILVTGMLHGSERKVASAGSRPEVIVALSDKKSVQDALLSICDKPQPYPPVVAIMIRDSLLAQVPSGTKTKSDYSGREDNGTPWDTGTTRQRITEGPLKGRRIWSCRSESFLTHPLP